MRASHSRGSIASKLRPSSKRPELSRLAGSEYVAVTPDEDGSLLSKTLGMRFGYEPGPPPRLAVEDATDSKNRTVI